MSFRILNQAPQYLLPSGKVNDGGRLYFYETDLSTPKDTWSDEALNVPNSNPVLMDGAGRTMTDVWGDGEYGVVMTDAAGVTIWTRNNVRSDAGAGTQIPALLSGQFLTNDGSVLQWQQIVLLPDLTGTNGNILYSDGALPYWAPPPSSPAVQTPDIVVTSGTNSISLRAGTSSDETKALIQGGQCTATSNNTKKVQVSVTFPIPFDMTPIVTVTARGGGITNGNGDGPYVPKVTILSKSTTGFTVQFNTNQGESNSDGNIISNADADWIAIGTKEVPAA